MTCMWLATFSWAGAQFNFGYSWDHVVYLKKSAPVHITEKPWWLLLHSTGQHEYSCTSSHAAITFTGWNPVTVIGVISSVRVMREAALNQASYNSNSHHCCNRYSVAPCNLVTKPQTPSSETRQNRTDCFFPFAMLGIRNSWLGLAIVLL